MIDHEYWEREMNRPKEEARTAALKRLAEAVPHLRNAIEIAKIQYKGGHAALMIVAKAPDGSGKSVMVTDECEGLISDLEAACVDFIEKEAKCG